MAETIVLETSGPPPRDTTVTFIVGEPRIIVVRHGPPDYIVFAELSFPPASFAERGREVEVRIRPRPGVYGLDLATSLAIRDSATVAFKYARFFAAPARARAIYGSDVVYERALAVGLVQTGGMLALQPSTRPSPDVLVSPLRSPGTYLVAAPQ